MAWITGTSTDYRNLLDQLVQVTTSDHVSAVAIAGGGSGHAVDDILTITDGTRTHSATLRVTSVATGVIDGIQVESWGAYTVDPDLTATTAWTTSGSGTGATFNLTMESDRWTIDRRAQEAVSAAIATAGTGYTVGDQLTLTADGGAVPGASAYAGVFGVLPVFEVATISGGGGTGPVASVTLVTAGHLEEVADVDLGTGGNQATVTGGTGASAVLTVTYQNVGASQEDLIVFNAPGSGSDNIRTAIRTHTVTDTTGFLTCYNWQLFGLVEYNAGLPLHSQVEISPGMSASTGARISSGAAYMILKENDADPDITFWMSITNRRMIVVCKVQTGSATHYSSMYLGLLNAFSTEALEPYPMWVQGCSNRDNAHWGDTQIGRICGLSDMYGLAGSDLNGAGVGTDGPAFSRVAGGSWSSFRNSSVSGDGVSPNRATVADFTMWPTGLQTYSLENFYDRTTFQTASGVNFDDIVPTLGNPGAQNYQLRPTPNTGDDVRALFPLTPLATDNPSGSIFTYQPLGELEGCFWLSASDATTALTSEDIQKDGEVRYIVFQNGNQNQDFSFFALKQD